MPGVLEGCTGLVATGCSTTSPRAGVAGSAILVGFDFGGGTPFTGKALGTAPGGEDTGRPNRQITDTATRMRTARIARLKLTARSFHPTT